MVSKLKTFNSLQVSTFFLPTNDSFSFSPFLSFYCPSKEMSITFRFVLSVSGEMGEWEKEIEWGRWGFFLEDLSRNVPEEQ